jgi:hypothetical protein
MRIDRDVTRGPAFEILVDGGRCPAFSGETVAAVMLANDVAAFRQDMEGRPRGMFCNMGTCYECMVTIDDGQSRRRLRGCLIDAVPGLKVLTRG